MSLNASRNLASKARNQGDTIKFTFRGVATEVANNAAAIEEHLTQLGENNFAGAMTERMNTLDGALSNLQDQWDKVFRAISEQGTGDVIEATVRLATDALAELTAWIESGALVRGFELFIKKFDLMADVAGRAFGFVQSIFLAFADTIDVKKDSIADDLAFVFRNLPELAAFAIEQAILELKRLGVVIANVGLKAFTIMKESFNAMVDAAVATGTAIGEALDPFNDKDLAQVGQEYVDRLKRISVETNESITESFGHIDTAVDIVDRQIDKLEQANIDKTAKVIAANEREAESITAMLENYKADQRGHTETTDAKIKNVDRLAKFSVGAAEKTGKTLSAKEKKRLVKEFREKVTSEKKLIRETLNLRKSEKDKLIQSHKDQVAKIKSLTIVSEEQKNLAIEALNEEHAEKIKELDFNLHQQRLNHASDFLGNLGQITEAFGRKGAKVAKALAIAQATIDTYAAANAAYKSAASIPVVGYILAPAAAAAAVAAGIANVSQIKSQNYAGSFEHGGMIPSGSFGIAGEAGAEIIRGPAQVTSARTTSGLSAGNPPAVAMNVQVVNNAPVEVQVEETEQGAVITIDQIEETLTNRLNSGRGDFAEAVNFRIKQNA